MKNLKKFAALLLAGAMGSADAYRLWRRWRRVRQQP